METRELYETAAAFALKLERLTDGYGIARERFTVRVRRCEGPVGAQAEDVYSVWVGLRGFDPRDRVDDIVAGIHNRWLAEGWRVTDYRRLRTGGLAVGGTDPATGDEYSWDTGFAARPGGYVVGSFATPCYRSPAGAVTFGEVALERLAPFTAEQLRGPNRSLSIRDLGRSQSVACCGST